MTNRKRARRRICFSRAFRRSDRRRWAFGRRRRLSPDQAMPRNAFSRGRGAGQLRRNVAHAQISRRPLRQRSLHLRLSLQAVDWPADRDGGGNPGLHGRGDRGERIRAGVSATVAEDRFGPLVERDKKLWTLEATRVDGGDAVTFTANFLWMCQGYYRHAEGLHARLAGHARLQGRVRPSPVVAERSERRRAKRRRHRFGRDRGDADSRDRGGVRARHVVAAVADLLLHRQGPSRIRRHVASARNLRRIVSRHHAPEDAYRKASLRAACRRRSRGVATISSRSRERTSGPTIRCAHFTPRYRPWRQRVALIPGGDLFARIARARSPSSPMRSTISTRRASFEVGRSASMRTSSSPRPASVSAPSATSRFSSTAPG